MLLLLVLAVEPPTQGADPGTLLLGVAAILAALTPLGVALVRRRGSSPDDDHQDDDLAEALRRRIQVKDDTIADLEADLRKCREGRQLADAEAHVASARIGQLEALLATEKAERRRVQAELDRRQAP